MSARSTPRPKVLRRAVAEVLEPRRLLTSYTITDLGTLPGGNFSLAIAVNASGEVVGYSDTDGTRNHDHAFLWTAGGGMQDLGTLPGGVFSHAEAINSAGDIVGYSRDSQGVDTAFFWSPSGGMVPIGSFVQGADSEAYGINDSNVVVGQAITSDGVDHAFVWTQADGIFDIGTLGSDSGETSFATAINNSNEVVGAADLDNGNEHAFIWTVDTGMIDLGTVFGANDSVAYDINAAGQVTGNSGDDLTFAFLWTLNGTDGPSDNPQMEYLGDFGGDLASGYSINASGQVVGYSEDGVSQYDEAAFWDTNTFDADNLNYDIPDNANWFLDSAYDNNDVGMIVGSGNAPDGDEHGFLLTPVGLGGPGAFVFAPDVTIADAPQTVDVFYYSDTSTIDTSTLDSSNVTVTGPDGAALGVTYTGETPGDGFITATYDVTAPDGAWNAADYGTYSVDVVAGSVLDANGQGVSDANTTFDCNLTIDSTWASKTDGSVTVPFTVEQVLQESDGNVLSVGHRDGATAGTSQGVLESFTSNSVIDPSFATGTKGVITTPTGENDAFYGAAIQPADGKIVAVGSSNGTFFVARYNPDGSQDTTFGNGGFATADFGVNDPAAASSVVIQPDGSILVGGVANGLMALARFTSSGSLDSSFNPGGAADPAFGNGGQRTISTGATSTLSQILLQSDGAILGVGNDGAGVAVFRLNPDGTDDGSFASGGLATLSQLSSTGTDGSPDLESLGVQPGGAILVGGQGAGGGLGVVRLTSSGQLDPTFSGGGFVNVGFGGSNDRADNVLVNSSDGAFILIGTTDAGGVPQTAIAAFNPDGSTNVNFGLNGKTTFNAPSSRNGGGSSTRAFHPQLSDFASAAVQSDGHVLIANTHLSTSSVRRIQPFSSSVAPTVNSFGRIGRKNVKLAPFALANGAVVTITLTGGGSGTESVSGNNLTLTLNGPAALTIKTRGGANSVNLSTVTVAGKLLSLAAPTATLTGMLSIPASAGNITLGAISGVVRAAGSITSLVAGSVSGSVSCGGILKTAKVGVVTGAIAAGISISNFTAGNLSGATVLAGTDLGSDGRMGGTGSSGDTYSSGQILTMKITGSIANSFIGAGVNPADGIFGNGNDIAAGAGAIKSLTVKGGVDSATRFEAVVFPKVVHIPGKVVPTADAHFIKV